MYPFQKKPGIPKIYNREASTKLKNFIESKITIWDHEIDAVKIIVQQLKDGADPNYLLRDGSHVISCAFGSNVARIFLRYGADPNICGGPFHNLLSILANYGFIFQTRRLLQTGVNPHLYHQEKYDHVHGYFDKDVYETRVYACRKLIREYTIYYDQYFHQYTNEYEQTQIQYHKFLAEQIQRITGIPRDLCQTIVQYNALSYEMYLEWKKLEHPKQDKCILL